MEVRYDFKWSVLDVSEEFVPPQFSKLANIIVHLSLVANWPIFLSATEVAEFRLFFWAGHEETTTVSLPNFV
jgi:hypothetical protein